MDSESGTVPQSESEGAGQSSVNTPEPPISPNPAARSVDDFVWFDLRMGAA